jgi:glycosyltransferase involved in cell wall biosynthesis
MIRGISRVRQAGVDVLLFVDADLARTVPILRWAGRGSGAGDVRGAISLIADLESQRELVLQTHLLLAPESAGEQRSIVLEAMAAGVPVLAGPDESSSAIVDGRTAMVIPRSTGDSWADAWADAIIRFTRSPEHWSALSRSAREAIRQDRLASASIACVLDGYRAGIARLAETQSGSTAL